MQIVLSNSVSFRNLSRRAHNEPANLLGMHHLINRLGGRSQIELGDVCGPAQLARLVKADGADTCGVSFTTISNDQIADWRQFFSEMREAGVTTIVGGLLPYLATDQFYTELEPDIAVIGEGELVFQAYFDHGASWSALEQLPLYRGVRGSTRIFGYDFQDRHIPRVALSSLGYKREYSLEMFDFIGRPYLQNGCPASCIFCPSDFKVRYKTPRAAIEEIGHLVDERSAVKLDVLGTDFFASSRHAAMTLMALISEYYAGSVEWLFNARPDTFWRMINNERRALELFAGEANGQLKIQQGIESFLPKRRIRLGKDHTPARAEQIPGLVDQTLAWCRENGVVLQASFITVDPESTLDEFEADLREIKKRLEQYPDHFEVVPGSLHNPLQVLPLTVSAKRYDTGQKQFGFAQDIRMRLIFAYIYSQKAKEEDNRLVLEEAGRRREFSQRTIEVVNRLLAVAHKVRSIPMDQLTKIGRPVVLQLMENNLDFFADV